MWLELIKSILEICLVPIIGALSAWLIAAINAKTNEIKALTNNALAKKYLDMLAQTVTDCVTATNQTYVEALKEKDLFDAEAQQEAFKMTYKAVLTILSDDAKEYLQNLSGDLSTLISNKIEAEVNSSKDYFE